MFIISQVWLTSHPRSTVVQELLVPVENFTVRMPMMGLELYWYQEFLCPVEPLYFTDEKSTTVEK